MISFLDPAVLLPRSLSTPVWQASGRDWTPQLHFTGEQDPTELRFIADLLRRYGRGVVAHFIYEPFPSAYSVELQFDGSTENRELMKQCLREYRSSFTDIGALKPHVAKRFQDGVKNDAASESVESDVLRCVLCEPGKMARELVAKRTADRRSLDETELEYLVEGIGIGVVGQAPYPFDERFFVLCDEEGLAKQLPYNRIGLVGSFIVLRRGGHGAEGLSPADTREILNDLGNVGQVRAYEEEYGKYMSQFPTLGTRNTPPPKEFIPHPATRFQRWRK